MTSTTSVRSESSVSAKGVRVALVVSSFHRAITQKLLEGAQECLRRHGAREDDVKVFRCPGAFELPQVANLLASKGGWDAIVCIGAVIRGETPHFEYVAEQSAAGIQQTALKNGIPVILGVLTTNTPEQAEARAGGERGNKGWDAAIAALEMIAVFKSIRPAKRPAKKR